MRIKIFCCAFLLLMLNFVVLYAQPGEPCGGSDDDGTCPSPLDTWVLILAAIVLVFAVRHLYRKQKSRISLPQQPIL